VPRQLELAEEEPRWVLSIRSAYSPL